MYQWEFERGEEAIAVATPGPLPVDESHTASRFGLAGVGIIYATEPLSRPYLASGALEPLLEDWAPWTAAFTFTI